MFDDSIPEMKYNHLQYLSDENYFFRNLKYTVVIFQGRITQFFHYVYDDF